MLCVSILQINSPVQLLDSEEEQSYLSLQPPPGRVINNTIQFETLDLYFWTGSAFRVPSLLFYAGPVYREGADDINATRDGELEEVGHVLLQGSVLLGVSLPSLLILQWDKPKHSDFNPKIWSSLSQLHKPVLHACSL